jgi:hypothetical protein
MEPPQNTRDPDMARREALREAVKKALEHRVTSNDGSERIRRRGAPFEQRRLAEHDLIDEITIAAARIADARDWNGEPVYRTDGIWRVLARSCNRPTAWRLPTCASAARA